MVVDPRKTTTSSSTHREVSSRLTKHHSQQHASHHNTYPRSSSSSASTSASISSPQNIKVFPFVVLAARMYEAHIMLAHLFILLNALILIPKLTIQLDSQLASQSLAWGRSNASGAAAGGALAATGFFSALTAWSLTSGILPQTIAICNKLGAIGAASTVVTFVFHDLYHREAGKRWLPGKTATRLQRVTPSSSSASAVGKDGLPASELESGLLLRGSPGGDSQPPFDQFDLGIPPCPHSVRRIPWCFF